MDKKSAYAELVRLRKRCHACANLVNPADVASGAYDHDHIGPWSTWQGNIDSPVMVIGQDWGTPAVFTATKGVEPTRYNYSNYREGGANVALVTLLAEIGYTIEPPAGRPTVGNVFFTNAILCLKPDDGKGLQSNVLRSWFDNCGRRFLRPLIDILQPKVAITLGYEAYRAVMDSYGLPKKKLIEAVLDPSGNQLNRSTRLLPMYHCGQKTQNMNRSLDIQRGDWRRALNYL